MDFNRGAQPFRPAGSTQTAATAAKDTTKKKPSLKGGNHDWNKIGQVALLFACLIVVLGSIFLLSRKEDQLKNVDKDSYQALSVNDGIANGGQIFFGKITKLNDKQVILTNVFYPQANSTGELFPFACTVAQPANQIILNRSQVSYWYNLQKESKVTKAIESYAKENNNKIDCSKFATQQPAANDAAGTSEETQTPPATGTENQQPTTNP